MQSFIDQHRLILMEAAIVEPIRRSKVVSLDPSLVHGGFIYDAQGRDQLRKIYREYSQVAIEANLPFLMCTPTWRTNLERVQRSAANPNINRDAVDFLFGIRGESGCSNIKVGGLIGCKNDCYQPQASLSAGEAETFHAWQIEQLSDAGADFLMAATLPSIDEATGIAKAMSTTGTPYFISFVIGRSGKLLDGTSLPDAIDAIDSQTHRVPIGYLVNCAYPTFLKASKQPRSLFSRLIGYQANASSLDHSELDCAENLHLNDIAEWGDEMLSLHRIHGMKILGGCCGTNATHLRCIARGASQHPSRNASQGV